MSTQIQDVIVPEVYATYTAVNSPEKTAFFESGVITRNPMLDARATSQGGDTYNLPFWNDLDSDLEPDLSDDSDNKASINKITAGLQIARSAFINKNFGSKDIAGELAGSSPMQQVANRFGTYWQRQWQKRLIATCDGILADNVANNAGDMVEDIATEDGDTATEANLFSRQAFTSAVFTLGDMAEDITAVAMHSVVYKRAVDNDDIDFIPDSQGNVVIPTYMGKRVILDDGMTVVAGATSGFKYTTVLFGNGAFGYGEGTPEVPVEMDRDALDGQGGGSGFIIERKTWLLHPQGFAVGAAPANGITYSLAELRQASSISRVVSRKNVPICFLVTNG